MTRTEIKELGIEDKTVIDAIMKLHGDGLTEVKTKLQEEIDKREKSITELSEKAKNLDGTETTLKEMQDKVAAYEKEKSDRETAEKQAKLDAELKTRFDAIKGENKFNHELIEKGRFDDFKKALQDEQFKGKGDSDIFSAIVKPEDLVNPQRQTVTMPGGNITTGNLDGVEKAFMQRNPNIKI